MNNTLSKPNEVFAVLVLAFLFISALDPIVKISAELQNRNLLQFLAHKQNIVVREAATPLLEPPLYIQDKQQMSFYKPEKTIRQIIAEAKESAPVHTKGRPLPVEKRLTILKDKVDQLKGVAVVYTQNKFRYKNEFSELNMYFRKLLKMKMPMSAEGEKLIVKKDGHMVEKNLKNKRISVNYNANIAIIKAVFDETQKAGTKMLFVIRPDKMLLTDEKEYRLHIKKYADALEKLKIPLLNLSEKFDEYSDKESLFYLSDHHWNARGAMLGASMLANELNKKYGFSYDLSYFFTEHFREVIYPNAAIGSYGKKVSKAYLENGSPFAGGEDAVFFLPTFKTSFQLELPFSRSVFSADFSSLLYTDEVAKSSSIYDNSLYTYLFSDASQQIIRNTRVADKKKILLIQDSYSRPSDLYLALQTAEICTVDPRYKDCPEILEFIHSYKPDVLVFLFDPDNIVDSFTFTWENRKFYNSKGIEQQNK